MSYDLDQRRFESKTLAGANLKAALGLAKLYPANVKRMIRGKFWMVQSHIVAPEFKNDRFGRPTVDWPGRSIFMTRKEAEDCAQALTKQYPDHAFFVMEAVEMVAAKGPVETRKEKL